MTVKKWVETSQEVDVSIGADDIRCALNEALARVNVRDCDDHPNRFDVLDALNTVGAFLNGFSDDNMKWLNRAQRNTIAAYLARAAARFANPMPENDYVSAGGAGQSEAVPGA